MGQALSTRTARMTATDWAAKFDQWSQGPGKTEEERCANAERMVRDAIDSYAPLKSRNIRVFVQGSFRNRTNVRADSDVDVCVLCFDTFYMDFDWVPGTTKESLGIQDATYDFDDLKRDVEAALVAKFGRSAVTPGDKAFDVKENTYHVAADVVPAFENRLCYRDSVNVLRYHSGTVLQSSKTGRLIYNWPEQHYENGVRKHTVTNRQFKKKVRILKNLCNEMCDGGNANAEAMASFLLESMVYNCPSTVFSHPTHYADMEDVIRHLYNATLTDDSAKDMVEVNDIKTLFHWTQAWNRGKANDFLLDAWRYVDF
jgi:hypothetical protein